MEFEKLFSLIHGLDSNQRRNLSLYAGGKKTTRPYKLYQRILKFPELTDETSTRIRGKLFLEPHQFHQDREKLARWVISSIVLSQNGKISPISFIKESFLHKADNLARKAFQNEIKRLNNSQKFGELADLHDLALELQNYYSIEIEWPNDPIWLKKNKIDPSFFDPSGVFERQNHERTLHQLIVQVRSVSRGSASERKEMANRILPQLRPSYPTVVCECLAMKIRMNLAYYLGEFHESFEIAKPYIELLMAVRDSLGTLMVARELRFVSMSAVLLNDRNSAVKYGMMLSELEPENRMDDSFISVSRTMVFSTIAGCFAETELAKAALATISLQEKEMNEIAFFKSYFKIGVGFFMNEDYRNAARCFHQVRNRVSKDSSLLNWEPSLYLAIAHYELGEINLSDSMLDSAQKSVMDQPHEYPKQCITLVRKYLKSIHPIQFLFPQFSQDLETIQSLLIDEEEKRTSIPFNVSIWMTSILQSKSQRTILLESANQEVMKYRLMVLS
jgi:hypothetical protein